MLHDLDVVLHVGAELGLFLNCQKSEVTCDDNDTRTGVLLSLQGTKVVDAISATLLGLSVEDVSSIPISLEERVKRLAVMG